MAIKQIAPPPEGDKISCPKCGEEAIYIDGRFVRWLKCPNCKFTKLMKKDDETREVKVVHLK